MASELDYAKFDELIKAVLASNATPERKRTAGAVIEYLMQTSVIDVWSESIANQFGYHDYIGRQDIRSVIVEKLLITLHAAQTGTTQRVNSWINFLFGLSRNAVRDYLESSQVTVASGMSSATRRRASIQVTHRQLLSELGSEPTRQEIIGRTNDYMLTTRRDAKKQGALVSDADFTLADIAVDLTDAARTVVAVGGGDADEIEHHAEASLATRTLIGICKDRYPEDDDLQAALAAWIELTLAGERVTAVALTEILGCTRARAKTCLSRIDEALKIMRQS